MAWLHATPKPDENSKRGQQAGKAKLPTRLESLTRRKIAPPMPPNPMPHIVARLIEIGLTEAAGMGAAPLSWATIEAWQRLTGVDIMPWEARLIRRLSVEYLAEGCRAESETCPPPWRTEITQREREQELADLERLLG